MQQFSLPQPPKIIKKEDNLAIIEINDLYPGYGITLGNALRRVLLSSVPGCAITTVKIQGVDHEFSTISNVSEDVIHILLNLKQIRFKLLKEETISLNLSIKGEKEVTAADFTPSNDVKIINPDCHIASLTDKKASLEMDIEIAPGVGYEPIERRHKDKLTIGSIAIDAIYTPIRRAKFNVENMRVGDRTDFNRLVFEIETDGSIMPEAAFKKAVDILDEHIKILGDIEVPQEDVEDMKAKKTKAKKSKNEA
jgi:DNA-directed RNA polymerase subunit alpha